MTKAVDEFVKQSVRPEYKAIVALIRKLVRETAPHAKEVISYGVPAWRGNRMLAFLSASKKEITVYFWRGGKFEDKYGLLQGPGQVSRRLKFRKLKDVKKGALRYYIKQALKFDKE
jgi:hypothetical protein